MGKKDSFLAALAVLVWSINLIVQKVAILEVDIFLLNFLRLSLVGGLVVFFRKSRIPFLHFIIAGLFWNAVNFTLIGFGLKFGVKIGTSSLLIQTNALFGIFFCSIILGERPSKNHILGSFVAFIGVALLTGTYSYDGGYLWGEILILLSSVSWGMGYCFIKKYGIGRELSDTAWLSLASIVPITLILGSQKPPTEIFKQIITISNISMGCILFSAAVATVLAGYIWTKLIQKHQSATLAPFMFLIPLFSGILSWVIMGEEMNTREVLSGVVILSGVFIAQFPRKKIGMAINVNK